MALTQTDIKLAQVQVTIEAYDLCLDCKDPDRRKPAGEFRRALVHDFDDGLTINWDNDYPHGVTMKGVRVVEGQDLGPRTLTEFTNDVEVHGRLDCHSPIKIIAGGADWFEIHVDASRGLVLEHKGLTGHKEVTFKSPVRFEGPVMMSKSYAPPGQPGPINVFDAIYKVPDLIDTLHAFSNEITQLQAKVAELEKKLGGP